MFLLIISSRLYKILLTNKNILYCNLEEKKNNGKYKYIIFCLRKAIKHSETFLPVFCLAILEHIYMGTSCVFFYDSI